jgi:hypothetical protein
VAWEIVVEGELSRKGIGMVVDLLIFGIGAMILPYALPFGVDCSWWVVCSLLFVMG